MDIAPSGCVDDAPHPFDPPDAMSPDAMLDTEAWRTESPAIAVERLLRDTRAATRRVDDVEQEANRLRSNVAAWVDDDRLPARLVRDQVRGLREAVQVVLGEDHLLLLEVGVGQRPARCPARVRHSSPGPGGPCLVI